MKSSRQHQAIAACAFALTLCGCVHRDTEQKPAFLSADSLPAQRELPDPLLLPSGERIQTMAQWNARRAHIKDMFEHYVYGPTPPKPRGMRFERGPVHKDFLGGKATLKLVTIHTGSERAPKIDLALIVPKGGPAKPPVFLVMNFCGNQAISPDKRIPLTHSWLRDSCKGSVQNAATEAARGTQPAAWPLDEIVNRGYALATFYSGDVDSDRQEVSSGLYQWLAQEQGTANNPTNRGTIATWAWGYQRCVDYLVKDGDIDPKRIAAVGHSRNGKTALLAAAFDERIAVAYPHQAGCGGSAPSRGTVGESVKQINDRFPHWFNGTFKEFNGRPERLPLDQHWLVALCAPRPVLFSAAQEDQWANPAGQFEVLRAATPVYQLLGKEGLSAQQMPPHGKLINSTLGYFIRQGAHSTNEEDWDAFLDFADVHLKKQQ